MLLPRLFRTNRRGQLRVQHAFGQKGAYFAFVPNALQQANPKDSIGCGDSGAGVGFKDIRTGDTLCDEAHPIVLEAMEFPEPVIGIAVEPKTQKDLDKLGVGLQKLAEEDPTFRVETNEETGQTVISGMGELHLDIIIDRLRREFKVECNQGRPQVTYKEAVTKPVELREVFKKQTGGRGKFADIIVRVEPVDEGFEGGLQFVDEVPLLTNILLYILFHRRNGLKGLSLS